jgi:hypothetical protein
MGNLFTWIYKYMIQISHLNKLPWYIAYLWRVTFFGVGRFSVHYSL